MAGRKRSYGSISGKTRYVAKRLTKRPRSAVRAAIAAVVPGYTRSGGSYGRYGRLAALRGLMPEKKFFDTALSFTFDSTGEVPATGQLALIPQGDTESTRDGRKATIESIQIRGQAAFLPGASATAAANVHLYVVLDTQTNGAAAAATDVFTSTNFSEAMLNLNNSGRFRILKHINITLHPQAGVSAAFNTCVRQVEFYKKCKIDMDWSSTTGAITEIRSNNIFLLAGSSASTDDLVNFAGNCRLRFRG